MTAPQPAAPRQPLTLVYPSGATRQVFPDQLLSPGEVAILFRVDPKTVSRWANQNLIASVRTLGGHRRFRADEVYMKLYGPTTTPGPPIEGQDPLPSAVRREW